MPVDYDKCGDEITDEDKIGFPETCPECGQTIYEEGHEPTTINSEDALGSLVAERFQLLERYQKAWDELKDFVGSKWSYLDFDNIEKLEEKYKLKE